MLFGFVWFCLVLFGVVLWCVVCLIVCLFVRLFVVAVVSDTCESVYVHNTSDLQKATSLLKRRAVLETWACTIPGPVLIRS